MEQKRFLNGGVCEALCYEAPRILFHGTAEEIVGDLRGGSYDGILWMALTPDVAQNYIPAAGIRTFMRGFNEWELDFSVRPESTKQALARMMGYEAEIELDKYQRLNSWMWNRISPVPQRGVHLVNRELKQFIESLGYQDEDGCYELKAGYDEDCEIVYPVDYKMPGKLFMLRPTEQLWIYDHALPEGDLLDLQYHHVDLFNRLRDKGYDGVRINDFAQSRNWGNFGHFSIGLFPSGISKCEMESIDAVNYDWPASGYPEKWTTPEYEFYLANKENSAA